MRESEQFKQKNDQLMTEMGYLAVHDPSKVYIRQIESFDDLTWRYRVYLPPKKAYILMKKASRSGSSGSTVAYDEQFTLTVALRRNATGEWQIRITLPRNFHGGGADSEIAEQLIKLDLLTGMRSDQKELDPNKPFDVLRLLNGDVHVWFEPGPD